MIKVPHITQVQLQYIADLEKLLEFGNQEFQKLRIHLRNIRHRKALLFQMVGAVHNYSYCVLTLLKEARTHGAYVLLRSILEAFINACYIYASRTIENAIRFSVSDERRLIQHIEKMIVFRSKHPNADTSQEDLPDEKLKETAKEIESWIRFLEKRYSYTRRGVPELRKRAEIVDEYLAKKKMKSLKETLEWNYLLIYWILSQNTHLSARGLNSFLTKTADAYIFALEGNPGEIERVAVTTYSFYAVMLNMLSLNFGIPTRKDIKPYLQVVKRYGQKARTKNSN